MAGMATPSPTTAAAAATDHWPPRSHGYAYGTYRNPSPTRYSLWDSDSDESSSGSSDEDVADSDSFSGGSDDSCDSDAEEAHPLGFDDLRGTGSRIGVTRFSLWPAASHPRRRDYDDGTDPVSVGVDIDINIDIDINNDVAWEGVYDDGDPLSPPRYDRRGEDAMPARTHMTSSMTPQPPRPPRSSALPMRGLSRRTATSRSVLRHCLRRSLRRREEEEGVGGDYADVLSGMDRLAALVRAGDVASGRGRHGRDDDAAAAAAEMEWEGGTRRAARSLLMLAEAAARADEATARAVRSEGERVRREQMRAAAALKSLLRRDEAAARGVLEREKSMADEALLVRRKEEEEAERVRRQEEEEAERVRRQEEERRKDEADRIAKQKEAEKRARAPSEHVVRARKMVSKLAELRESIAPFEKSKAVSKRRLHIKKLVRGKLNTLNHDLRKIEEVAAGISSDVAAEREMDDRVKQEAAANGGQLAAPEMARGKRYLLDLLSSNVIVRAQAEGFGSARGDGFPLANTIALISMQVKELSILVAAHIYAVCPMAIPYVPSPEEGSSESDLMESIGMKRVKDSDEFESFDRFLSRTEGLISVTAALMCSRPEGHTVMGGQKGAVNWLARFLTGLPKAPAKPLPLTTAPVLVAFLTAAGHMLARVFPKEFHKLLSVVVDDIIPRLDEGDLGAPSSVRLKKTVEGGFEGFVSNLPTGAIPELYENGDDDSYKPGTRAAQSSEAARSSNAPFGQHQTGALPSSSGSFPSSGANSGTAMGPFGQKPQPPDQNNLSTNPSTLGSPFVPSRGPQNPQQQQTSPFGAFQHQQQQQTTPFGVTQNQQQHQPQQGQTNPFGVAPQQPQQQQQQQQSTPFGVAQSMQPGPFGGGSQQQIGTASSLVPNPFGGPAQQNTTQSNPFASSSGGFQPEQNVLGGGNSFGGGNSDGGGRREGSGRPACKFFLQGKCRNGASCTFSHDTQQQGKNGYGGGNSGTGRPPCKFFAQGRCNNANCRFSHENP